VLEYLAKKGYSRTEAILRKEAAQVDTIGLKRAENFGGKKYDKAYSKLTCL
jgi:transcription initiation factor TFIID subunit 5